MTRRKFIHTFKLYLISFCNATAFPITFTNYQVKRCKICSFFMRQFIWKNFKLLKTPSQLHFKEHERHCSTITAEPSGGVCGKLFRTGDSLLHGADQHGFHLQSDSFSIRAALNSLNLLEYVVIFFCRMKKLNYFTNVHL